MSAPSLRGCHMKRAVTKKTIVKAATPQKIHKFPPRKPAHKSKIVHAAEMPNYLLEEHPEFCT